MLSVSVVVFIKKNRRHYIRNPPHIKADFSANNEKIQHFQDLNSVKDDINSKISQLQENNAKFQENSRAEIKAKNEMSKKIWATEPAG
jgi:hypothetical protein